MKRVTKKRIIVSSLVLAVALGSWLWSRLSVPLGDQKVDYVPAAKECFGGAGRSAGGENPWNACIYRAVGGVNGDVAYMFHGRHHDEHIWNDDTYYSAMVQEEWQRRGVKPPTVVAVSFGGVWLLTPKLSRPDTGLLAILTNEIIPETETRLGGPPRRRLVFGESMGGVNTLLTVLHAGRLFQKAAALCPPIYKVSLFSKTDDVFNFLNRSGGEPKALLGIMALGRKYAVNDEEWNQIAPVRLVETVDPKTVPELYLSCGLYDKYGNYEGVKTFVDRARERGLKVDWRPLYGGHCAVDIASLAEFLVSRSTMPR